MPFRREPFPDNSERYLDMPSLRREVEMVYEWTVQFAKDRDWLRIARIRKTQDPDYVGPRMHDDLKKSHVVASLGANFSDDVVLRRARYFSLLAWKVRRRAEGVVAMQQVLSTPNLSGRAVAMLDFTVPDPSRDNRHPEVNIRLLGIKDKPFRPLSLVLTFSDGLVDMRGSRVLRALLPRASEIPQELPFELATHILRGDFTSRRTMMANVAVFARDMHSIVCNLKARS